MTRCATRASRSSPSWPRAKRRRSTRSAKVRVDYEPLPRGVRRRGGAQARRPGGQRDLPGRIPSSTTEVRPPEAALRRRRAGLRRGRPSCSRSATRCRRSSMRRPRPTARSPRPRPTAASSCYTCTQALFFSLDTAAKILDVPSNQLHFIGGTVGGGFGGKVDSLTEPLAYPRRDADRAAGALRARPRGGDAVRLAARRRAHLRQGRRDAATAASSRARSELFRQRRLHAAFQLRRDQVRRRTLPGPYTIPNVHADCYCVYTNRTPATAMRGFGVTGGRLRARSARWTSWRT